MIDPFFAYTPKPTSETVPSEFGTLITTGAYDPCRLSAPPVTIPFWFQPPLTKTPDWFDVLTDDPLTVIDIEGAVLALLVNVSVTVVSVFAAAAAAFALVEVACKVETVVT